MNLNDLRDAIYADAVAHGLWENDAYWCDDEDERQREMRCQAAYMIKSEAKELIDVANVDVCKDTDSVEEYAEELADVIIMSLSVAGKLSIDIDAAVRRKMEINKARPWKHGKDTNVPTGNSGGSVGNGGGGYVGNGGEGDTKTKITLLD